MSKLHSVQALEGVGEWDVLCLQAPGIWSSEHVETLRQNQYGEARGIADGEARGSGHCGTTNLGIALDIAQVFGADGVDCSEVDKGTAGSLFFTRAAVGSQRCRLGTMGLRDPCSLSTVLWIAGERRVVHAWDVNLQLSQVMLVDAEGVMAGSCMHEVLPCSNKHVLVGATIAAWHMRLASTFHTEGEDEVNLGAAVEEDGGWRWATRHETAPNGIRIHTQIDYMMDDGVTVQGLSGLSSEAGG